MHYNWEQVKKFTRYDVDFSYKRPAIRESFPHHDVIMIPQCVSLAHGKPWVVIFNYYPYDNFKETVKCIEELWHIALNLLNTYYVISSSEWKSFQSKQSDHFHPVNILRCYHILTFLHLAHFFPENTMTSKCFLFYWPFVKRIMRVIQPRRWVIFIKGSNVVI